MGYTQTENREVFKSFEVSCGRFGVDAALPQEILNRSHEKIHRHTKHNLFSRALQAGNREMGYIALPNFPKVGIMQAV